MGLKSASELRGMRAVEDAVTFAAYLMSQFQRKQVLDDRDRTACEEARHRLERAERILYGTDAIDETLTEDASC